MKTIKIDIGQIGTVKINDKIIVKCNSQNVKCHGQIVMDLLQWSNRNGQIGMVKQEWSKSKGQKIWSSRSSQKGRFRI